jgi:uncharacterized protein YndB with AHSA1/START domain
MDTPNSTERSLVLPIERKELWKLLTRPEELSEWFGAEVLKLELHPGGDILFRTEDGGVRQAEVQIIDPPHRFTFRWLSLEDSDGSARAGDGTVEFLLEETREGTRLTVTEQAPVDVGKPESELPVVRLPLTGEPQPEPPGAPPRIYLHV